METFTISFEVETNLSKDELKAALIEAINRGGIVLENRLEDFAEIDSVSVAVVQQDN